MIGASISSRNGKFQWKILQPCVQLAIPHLGSARDIQEAVQKIDNYEQAASQFQSLTDKGGELTWPLRIR